MYVHERQSSELPPHIILPLVSMAAIVVTFGVMWFAIVQRQEPASQSSSSPTRASLVPGTVKAAPDIDVRGAIASVGSRNVLVARDNAIGEPMTIRVRASTFISVPEAGYAVAATVNDLAAGQRVIVRADRDPESGELTASSIVVPVPERRSV